MKYLKSFLQFEDFNENLVRMKLKDILYSQGDYSPQKSLEDALIQHLERVEVDLIGDDYFLAGRMFDDIAHIIDSHQPQHVTLQDTVQKVYDMFIESSDLL